MVTNFLVPQNAGKVSDQLTSANFLRLIPRNGVRNCFFDPKAVKSRAILKPKCAFQFHLCAIINHYDTNGNVITPAVQLPASCFLRNVSRSAFSRNSRTIPASYHQPASWSYSSLSLSTIVCIVCAFIPFEGNIHDYASHAGTSACVKAVKRKTIRVHNSLG